MYHHIYNAQWQSSMACPCQIVNMVFQQAIQTIEFSNYFIAIPCFPIFIVEEYVQ